MKPNVKRYGAEPFNIAVIHGGPGAAGEMEPLAVELSKRKGVLEPIQTTYSVGTQIEELKTAINKYADYPLILIGFSWGAWLSVLLASKYPLLVKKLILIGCPPFAETAGRKIYQTRLNRLNKTEKKEFEFLMKYLDGIEPPIKNEALERLIALLSKTDTYSPIKEKEPVIDFDLRIFKNVWEEASRMRKDGLLLESLKKLDCPVTALHGDYDPHPWDNIKDTLSAYIDRSVFVCLKNCGHKPWIETEAKKEFYEIISREIFFC